MSRGPNSLHLSTKLFAHFWSWWSLFDGALSLPIRQGPYHPRRVITPKLGRHIATIKYLLSVPRLYVMHGYLDDSEDSEANSVACNTCRTDSLVQPGLMALHRGSDLRE